MAVMNKKGKAYVPMDKVGQVVMESLLSYRHMVIRTMAVRKLRNNHGSILEIEETIETGIKISEEERGSAKKKSPGFLKGIWRRLRYG